MEDKKKSAAVTKGTASDQQTETNSRRRFVKASGIGVPAVLGATLLPSKWVSPVINSVVTPVHAQTSDNGMTDGTDGSATTTIAPTTVAPTTVPPTTVPPTTVPPTLSMEQQDLSDCIAGLDIQSTANQAQVLAISTCFIGQETLSDVILQPGANGFDEYFQLMNGQFGTDFAFGGESTASVPIAALESFLLGLLAP